MRSKSIIAGLALLMLCGVAVSGDETAAVPEMPKPQQQHEWLQALVGEWNAECTIYMPGEPPMETKGTDSTHSLGGFWVISSFDSSMMGTRFRGVMTLGYDVAKDHYVGTWIDSMSTNMWQYEGSVDEAGKILTLRCEGPHYTDPTKTAQYKETLEIKDKNRKVFMSHIQSDDGGWTRMMQIDYRRAVQPSSGKSE